MNPRPDTPRRTPRVLTIAGSDSSGGAGIEADLKVITSHGVYGMTAITALTAQNTHGVNEVHVVPAVFLAKEIAACVEDVGVDIVKTGMLASEESIRVVASALQEYSIEKTVIDPVMISTSNYQLLPDSAVSAYITELLPRAYILTPNIPEALRLLNLPAIYELRSIDEVVLLAQRLHALGPNVVLLKGGHLPFKPSPRQCGSKYGFVVAESESEKISAVDVIYDGEEVDLIVNDWVKTTCTHGTGCSLASAIAANLARGHSARDAIREGCRFISEALKSTQSAIMSHEPIGNGPYSPLNHLYRINKLLDSPSVHIPPGGFIDWLLRHPKVKDIWYQYTHHEFVDKMGKGTLDVERFKFYLQQDYLFLIQFARANSLSGYKSGRLDDICRSAAIVLHIQKEMALHINYCAGFGISKEELEKGVEHQACTAYTRFVLDTGVKGTQLHLQIAMLPCLLGYFAIADRLYTSRTIRTTEEGNIYYKWIQNYVAEDYREAVVNGKQLLEKAVEGLGSSTLEELVEVFAVACKMETGFWEMGMRGQPTESFDVKK